MAKEGEKPEARKRAEEALRETRDYLESLINYANAPIIVWDPEFRITRFNHAFEHYTGYTAHEVVGQELRMLFPEDGREQSLSKIGRTLSGEYWESVEIPILRKDGDTRVALWNSANIYAEDGTTLLATIAQGVDITERKRAEEALRESEERFRTIVETAPSLLLITDAEGRNIYVSPNCEEISGYTQEELQGRETWWVHEDDTPRAREVVDRTYREGVGCRDVEYKAVKKNGELWYGSSSWEPIRDAEGKLEGVVFQTVDITERKRAEGVLRTSAQQWRTTFDAISEAVFLLDPEQRIVRCNTAMTNLVGKPFSEIIGRTCWELMHGTSEPIEGCPIVRMWETRRTETMVLPMGDRWFNVAVDPVLDEAGNLVGAVHIISDITERKRAEEEIRRRSDELAALYDVSLDVAAQLEIAQLLQIVIEHAIRLLDARGGGIYLYDPAKQELELRVSYGHYSKDYRETRLALGEGLSGKVAQSGEALVVEDYAHWEARSPQYDEEPSMNVLGVPLKRGDELLGVLFINHELERSFDEADIRLATLFANQAAIAIENARLYEQTDEKLQHRVAELTALQAIAESTTSTLELDEILESIVTRVAQVMGTRICTIRLVEGDELTIGAAVGYRDESSRQHTIEIDERLARIVRDQQPLLVEDLWKAEDIPRSRRERAERERVHSFLGVPMISKGETIGVLSIYSERPHRFTEEEISLLLTIANQAALAIENARLYERTIESAEAAQHRAERLQSLQQASASLISSLSLEEVVRRIADEALRNLKTEGVYLLMLNEKEKRLEGRILASSVDRAALSTIERLWGSKLDELKIPLSRKENWLVQVLATGEPRLGIDLSEMAGDPVAEYWREPLEELVGTPSISIVPLRSRGKVLGLMLFTTPPYKEMSEEDRRLIETYANQAALAIENARLYERLREHAEELERLVQERTRELRAIHTELLKSAKLAALGQLAAGVAHELNNPLGVISGYLELLQEEMELEPRGMKYMERIEKNIQQATKIVRELRSTWIPSEPAWQIVGINDILEETLTLVERGLSLHLIEVQKEMAPNLPQIHADPDRLQQVFINLITNARQAMGERGALRIVSRESRNGEWVEIIFADTGEGIAEEHLDKIFDPFFTTRSPGEAMGLGLSISHRHIRDHGGAIDFWSERGRGAVFRVALPPSGAKRCWEILDCDEKERCKAVRENADYRCWSVKEDASQCERCEVYRRKALPPLDGTLLPE